MTFCIVKGDLASAAKKGSSLSLGRDANRTPTHGFPAYAMSDLESWIKNTDFSRSGTRKFEIPEALFTSRGCCADLSYLI